MRRRLWPVVPMIAAILYSALYYLGVSWLRTVFGDIAAFQSLMYVLTFERRFAHMKNARIIAVLVLLTLSLSGCTNADRSEVSAPSSQEMVTNEPAQSNVPQEQTTVSVSESTEIPAETTAEPEPIETKPKISTPAKEETPPTVSSPTETTPAESIRARTIDRTY